VVGNWGWEEKERGEMEVFLMARPSCGTMRRCVMASMLRT
jgi:hypothetical protein